MSHPARPLKILIASSDSDVLLELSEVLRAVGFTVLTSKDVSETATWRRFSEIDFLLFDGRSIARPSPAVLEHRSDNALYRIFLYDRQASVDLSAWFAVGANDALQVPISRGELLARVRTGARFLAFETRMRSHSSRSRLPGMYSRRGLLRKLSKFTTEGQSTTLGHTLLTTAIDFFAGFCREEGEAAARGLLEALSISIQQSIGGNAIVAYNDDGTFHILLPAQNADAAHVIAEQISQQFRAAQDNREPVEQLSLTTAIVPWRVGMSAEQLLVEGDAALAIAEQAGGDCTIEQKQFEKKLASLQDELTAGNPFASSTAQDIMEPFPAVLEHDSPNQALLAALRRGGAPVWPFVDHEGRLMGVALPASETDDVAGWEPNSTGSQALTKPKTIAHNAAFAEIHTAFSTEDCEVVVVVANHRPIGYLTRRSVLSLIEPIDSATYSSDEPVLEDSRGLLVGSHVTGSELESDSDLLHFHLPARELIDQPARPARR
jgi:GGDEF domain-containing protein